MRRAGLRVERMTHLFSPFLPVIAAKRWARKGGPNADAPRSDLEPLPRWLNETCYAIARAEQLVARYVDMPAGSTILAVGRKVIL